MSFLVDITSTKRVVLICPECGALRLYKDDCWPCQCETDMMWCWPAYMRALDMGIFSAQYGAENLDKAQYPEDYK